MSNKKVNFLFSSNKLLVLSNFDKIKGELGMEVNNFGIINCRTNPIFTDNEKNITHYQARLGENKSMWFNYDNYKEKFVNAFYYDTDVNPREPLEIFKT